MHPKQLKLFRAWAKAMELGATVDKPSYSKTRTGSKKTARRRVRRRKRNKRSLKQQTKKD